MMVHNYTLIVEPKLNECTRETSMAIYHIQFVLIKVVTRYSLLFEPRSGNVIHMQ